MAELSTTELDELRLLATLPTDKAVMPVKRETVRALLDLMGERDRAIDMACALEAELAEERGYRQCIRRVLHAVVRRTHKDGGDE